MNNPKTFEIFFIGLTNWASYIPWLRPCTICYRSKSTYICGCH